jgi:hypothetical protein
MFVTAEADKVFAALEIARRAAKASIVTKI